MRPLLSVVVPFYGVEDYIGPCLESLRRQTLQDIEVLMVDDGSPDGSARIAEDFARRDGRFRLIRQENQGLGPARNTGSAHAVADFITFVDSDDLVPWRAYEHMVGTLTRSGSDLVAGNARRFNRSGGVRPSWVHRIPFARTRLATHVTTFPELVLDRMVWNKVYRRDFWEHHHFAFPSIRYEDYPVTLPAHLAALTVDVLAQPVYYWRERESGDSITQQVFRYDNLLDRVRSAEMVFDVVERAPAEVRERTHAHLAEIDLTALVQAFEVVPKGDVAALVDLGQRFTNRLTPAALSRRSRFDRIQFSALRAGDVPLLRELADYRASGAVAAGHVRRNRTRPWVLENDYPGRGSAQVPRSNYRLPRSSLQVASRVDKLSWSGTTLRLAGSARIRHLTMRSSDELALTLIAGARRIPVPLTRLALGPDGEGGEQFTFNAELDTGVLRDLPWVCWPVVFQIYVRRGTIRRRVPLRGLGGGSPYWPSGVWLDEGQWVQPTMRNDGALQLTRVTGAAVVESVEVEGVSSHASFVLRGRAPVRTDDLRLAVVRRTPFATSYLPAELEPISEESTAFTARIPLSELTAGETPEDPYTLRSGWDVRLAIETGTLSLLWPSTYASASVQAGGRVFTLGTTAGGYVRVSSEPPRVHVDEVRMTSNGVELSGSWWEGAAPTSVSWRHYLPHSEDYVDVAADLSLEPSRWVALAGYPDPGLILAGTEDEPVWTLMATLPGDDEAVVCSPSAGHTLPQWVDHRSGRWAVAMVRDTLRLEVT